MKNTVIILIVIIGIIVISVASCNKVIIQENNADTPIEAPTITLKSITTFLPSTTNGNIHLPTDTLEKNINTPTQTKISRETGCENRLLEIIMIDSKYGWGKTWGMTKRFANTEFEYTECSQLIAHTDDGGNEWGNFIIATALFVNNNISAWAAGRAGVDGNGLLAPLEIYNTTNGGLDWNKNDYYEPSKQFQRQNPYAHDIYITAKNIQFISQYGWIELNIHPSSGEDFEQIIRSDDNGNSWIIKEEFYCQKKPGIDGSSHMVFMDRQIGWWGGISWCSINYFPLNENTWPFHIALTGDGGIHWFEKKLPPPNDFIDGKIEGKYTANYDSCNVIRIDRITLSEIGLHMACNIDKNMERQPWNYYYYYYSVDNGANWKIWRSFGDTYFLSQKEGWRIVYNNESTGLEITEDGGINWNQVSLNVPDGKIQFVSKLEGWILSTDNKLFATRDGGKTWLILNIRPVDPSIFPIINDS